MSKSIKLTPAILAEIERQIDARMPKRVKLDRSVGYTAIGVHTIDLGRPYSDVIVIPQMGGNIATMDRGRADEGLLKISFTNYTRLAGAWVFPVSKDDGSEENGAA